MELDPGFKTDRLTSAILEFPAGQCIFAVSTQLVYYQRMQFLGTEGRWISKSRLTRRQTSRAGYLLMTERICTAARAK